MRLSDESTEKFEIELANEQVKKIKQAINDCQLRFGKVMGCGTCKALQLCTWAKELSSTIESMGKYIEALQQEIEQLKDQNDTLAATVNMFAPYIIGKKESEVVEELKELLTLKHQNQALTADKDEQAGRLMKMDYLLRRTLPILAVTNDQQELIEQINELLGGKEDEK